MRNEFFQLSMEQAMTATIRVHQGEMSENVALAINSATQDIGHQVLLENVQYWRVETNGFEALQQLIAAINLRNPSGNPGLHEQARGQFLLVHTDSARGTPGFYVAIGPREALYYPGRILGEHYLTPIQGMVFTGAFNHHTNSERNELYWHWDPRQNLLEVVGNMSSQFLSEAPTIAESFVDDAIAI